MKRTVRLISTLALTGLVIASCSPLEKMKKKAADISYKVTPEVVEEKGGMVDVKIDVTIPPKFFNKKVMLTATPALTYQGGEKDFAPQELQGESVTGNATVVPYEAGKTISYTGQVPYEEAMRLSELVIKIQAAKGVRSVAFDPVKVADGVVATATLVNNEPAVAIGKDNFVRVTPELSEAAIYYLINSAQVRGNQLTSEEIKLMEKFLKDAKADENLNLKNVEIRSYASPDGGYDLNAKLADRREGASTDYLKANMRKNKVEEYKNLDFFKQSVMAEDWDGFKKAMEESNIRDKELILRVLSMHSDPEVREKEIKNIASAYSTIADQILPKLRRSKFVVNAERIGKSDEELQTLAKSNPSELNVEELLYAATLFDLDADKLAVYESAKKQFPEDWRGFNDAGMVQYNMGKMPQAKADFEKADQLSPNNKVVKNNLGALALRDNNVKEAEVLFGAATGAGDEVNYNKGIIAIKKGDYKAAVDYFGTCTCANAALANLLNGNNSEALRKLNASKDESALVSYLKAVVGARNNDVNMVITNLREAVAKDGAVRQLAATDIEFAKFFDNADFKAIVQ